VQARDSTRFDEKYIAMAEYELKLEIASELLPERLGA
jgi:hypothetical protein